MNFSGGGKVEESDEFWIVATLWEAAVGTGDADGATKWKAEVERLSTADWMMDISTSQIAKLEALLETSPLSPTSDSSISIFYSKNYPIEVPTQVVASEGDDGGGDDGDDGSDDSDDDGGGGGGDDEGGEGAGEGEGEGDDEGGVDEAKSGVYP